jgi:hypothetical protein
MVDPSSMDAIRNLEMIEEMVGKPSYWNRRQLFAQATASGPGKFGLETMRIYYDKR